jgi:hypothetical protein
MNKVSEKSKAFEEKVEAEFAQKMLEIITTCNHNFVELNKKVFNSSP